MGTLMARQRTGGGSDPPPDDDQKPKKKTGVVRVALDLAAAINQMSQETDEHGERLFDSVEAFFEEYRDQILRDHEAFLKRQAARTQQARKPKDRN